VAETVINILPQKNEVKVAAPKIVAKEDAPKVNVQKNTEAPQVAAETKISSTAPVVPKEIIIYSNKANQESVQPLAATVANTSPTSENYVTVDAATGVATLQGIKIIGTVDFTGAEVRGLRQTVVNNYSSGAPMVVYNSTTKENETWQTLSGQTGGVSNFWSVGKDLTVGQNASVASILTVGTASSNGSLTVNGAATITGATTFSGATTLSGASTLSSDLTVNGNTTLGDSSGDTVTINGRLSTLNVSDGSTTSSLSKNSFYIAADSSNALGKFYVDSSGNVSASGTITSVGGITMSGHLNPSSENLYDVGSSSTQWRYGNFQGGLLVADGSNTSTLVNTSLIIAQGSGNNLGKFYIDSSGNTFTSGTLQTTGSILTYGNVTSTGNIYPASNAEASLGGFGAAFNNVFASGTVYGNAANFTGNVTLGDNAGDSITIGGKVDAGPSLLPLSANATASSEL